jgi:hypothetical protein
MDRSKLDQTVLLHLIGGALMMNRIYLNPVKLIHEYNPLDAKFGDQFDKGFGERILENLDYEMYHDIGLTEQEIDAHFRKFNNLSWDYVPFCGVHALNARSNSVGVLSEYGFSDTELRHKMASDKDLTFRDYVDAVYRLKTYKYNNWEELLVDIKFQFDANMVHMDVEFDYGH